MKKCPYCERSLKFWQFKCRLCNRFVWRIPQILIIAVSFLILISIVVITAEYVALNKDSTEKKQGVSPSAVRERPRY